jgi:Uma2 family endonuclease
LPFPLEPAINLAMNAALAAEFLTVEDYLAGEEISQVRHEYIGGAVYAMAGASDSHNTIGGNLFAAIRPHLRGGPCRTFITDMKLALEVDGLEMFYYPDLMITCDPRDTNSHFKRFPNILIEILSDSTERIDRGEKFANCIQIETLDQYIVVSQKRPEVTSARRANGWKPEVLRSMNEKLELPSINFSISLEQIYEDSSVTP